MVVESGPCAGTAFALGLLHVVDDFVNLFLHAIQAHIAIEFSPNLGLGTGHKHLAFHILFLDAFPAAEQGVHHHLLGFQLGQQAVVVGAAALAHQPFKMAFELLQGFGGDVELEVLLQQVLCDLAEVLLGEGLQVETELKQCGHLGLFAQIVLQLVPQPCDDDGGHRRGTVVHAGEQHVELGRLTVIKEFLRVVDDEQPVLDGVQVFVHLGSPRLEVGGVNHLDVALVDHFAAYQPVGDHVGHEVLSGAGVAQDHTVHLDVYLAAAFPHLPVDVDTFLELTEGVEQAVLGKEVLKLPLLGHGERLAAMLAKTGLVTVLGLTMVAFGHCFG